MRVWAQASALVQTLAAVQCWTLPPSTGENAGKARTVHTHASFHDPRDCRIAQGLLISRSAAQIDMVTAE